MNAYKRLNYLFSYLSYENFPATISNLSKVTGIYEEQIKQDIEYLLNYEAPKGNLLFAPHITKKDKDGETEYHFDAKAFTNHTPSYYSNTPKQLVPMTLLDYYLVNNGFYTDFNIFDRYSFEDIDFPFSFAIKDPFLDEDEDEENVADEDPFHVKLKIYEDNLYIIDLIKADTKHRVNGVLTGPFPPSNSENELENETETDFKPQFPLNIYYYEDDVIGKDAFKKWLQQFKASVVVEEPVELAREIYDSL